MKKFELNFSFKGERQYIHGTDILDKSSELVSEYLGEKLEQVDFVIHRMTDRNLSLVLYPNPQMPELAAMNIAVLKFAVRGKPWEARLTEKEDHPADTCLYDENAVTELCRIDKDERKVLLLHDTPYTNIETLVAMTKMLHINIFPNMTGSWVFCRWNSSSWPLRENLKGICIQLKQALGTRLTKSEVSVDLTVLGHIYFSARNNK